MGEIALHFDAMEDNTDLAKEYITAHNGSFYPSPLGIPKEEFILDNANNKLYQTEIKVEYFDGEEYDQMDGTPSQIDRALFEKLAIKVKDNSQLFAQLEVLIRKKEKEEVINWDIQLIVQSLLYHSANDTICSNPEYVRVQVQEFVKEFCTYNVAYPRLKILNNSPLANLGYLAEKLLKYDPVHIVASQNTGVVCYLFTKLCHEVGLRQVQLTFESSDSVDREDPARRCVGVITGQSDVDSAVDILLSSSTQYPWKVGRILVQESIYETVRKAFQGKCDLKTVDQKYKTSSTDAMTRGDKLILFEDVANHGIKTEGDEINIILVEAYRTTKELISLINKQQPFCISLWCSNVAEVDEIAHSANTHIVWVNEFGSFWGPPDASQAFYSMKSEFLTVEMNLQSEKMMKQRDAWKKTDLKSRKALVKEAINSCADHNDYKARVLKLIRKTSSEKEMFIEIQDNRMCIGERKLSDVLLHFTNNIEEAITYLISGKALIASDEAEFKDWLEELAKKGLPMIFQPKISLRLKKKHEKTDMTCSPSTKVVYKNFGTIFAN